MGYYIQTPKNTNKVTQICQIYDAIQIDRPKNYSDIPDDMGLIVIVDNGIFEAAGFIFSEREFNDFLSPRDNRYKWYVLMDRKKAEQLSGFKQ